MSHAANLPQCIHYDLALKLLPEPMHPAFKLYGGTIQATCTATIQNDTSGPLDKVPLLLYRMLQVQAAHDAGKKALPFTQSVLSFPDLPRKQVNAIEISLPTPLPSGETTQLRLRYAGPVCGYSEVWPYQHDHVSEAYTLLRRDVLWFPVVGRSNKDCWRGSSTFDLSITVPNRPDSDRPWIAVSHGVPGTASPTPQGRRSRWRSAVPTRPLTVACAPFCQEAISADVALYYLPDDEVGAQVVARAMRRTRALCSAWFGPMPAGKLRIVEIPKGWGSEASPTLILQTGDAFQADGPEDRVAYRRALSRAGHELIHLWGVHSTKEHASRFLNEGITQYLEALLLRQEIGEEAYWKRLNDYRAYFCSGGEAAASIPLSEAGRHDQVREEISRGKGPWLMCVLHHLLGKQLLPALRAFFDRYREQGATLEDFQDSITAAADTDLSAFFQEWLWGTRSSAYLAQETSGPELASQLAGQYMSPTGENGP
jgi:hypothetical protein